MGLPRAILVMPLLLLGCGDGGVYREPTPEQLPPLKWEGKRVVFGTNILDEVCVGTLSALDASVESIEQELSLSPSEEKIQFYLLDDETFVELCGSEVIACVASVDEAIVYSSAQGMTSKRHELVHARLAQLGIWGGRLWGEGIAAALDKSGGCLESQLCRTAELDALLQGQFGEILAVAYMAGADLVHGLLMNHGPESVLAFMGELSGKESPDEVRSIYLKNFGSVLDDDFQAYMRGPFDEYTLAQRGCDSLISAPVAGEAGGIAIQATMDCSSPDVVNIHHEPGAGQIEWGFVVTAEQSGAFTVSWSPAGEFFSVESCHPPIAGVTTWNEYSSQSGNYATSWKTSNGSATVILAPGQYKVRWPAEFGASAELTLVPPCNFETSECPAGEQCNIWNECHAQIVSPVALGSPCVQQPGAPLVCEKGSRCVGGICVAECDVTQPCDPEESCSRSRVCGPICHLLAQDCGPGFTCLPSDDDSLTSAGMGVCLAAGEGQLLDSCDWRQNDCSEGLSCETESEICVPLCDPKAPDLDCPDEVPICNPLREGPAGFCREKKTAEE